MEIKTIASGSRGNCYHLTDGETPLLLEAGISIKRIKRGVNFKLSQVKGALITHEHGDHAKAKSVLNLVKMGINCYMSKGTRSKLSIPDEYSYRIRIVAPKLSFKIGTWVILPLDAEHDAEEPLCYLLANKDGEKLLFATDTYYLKYKFKGLTHLMLECNYALDTLDENIENGSVHPALRKRIVRSHFSLGNVKEFLKANDLSEVQEIHLIHSSSKNGDKKRFMREIEELTGKMVFTH